MEEHRLAFGDESALAKKVREMLGAGDYDEVRVTLPQFNREDGKSIRYFPTTKEEFDGLRKAPDDILKDLGLQQWEEGHWLYPAEWYDYIPEGYIVTAIDDEEKPFQRGVTSDDRRFGCLAYGFKKTQPEVE